jgi:PhoH-like ATPase
MKKIFILDTNVILYDCNSIYNFQDNDIIIPITVLEELDKFKKGNDVININARNFIRDLDLLFENSPTKDVSLGNGLGCLSIAVNGFNKPAALEVLDSSVNDNIILNFAYNKTKQADANYILVTKDINLRMKAKALGICAQDYETGKVKNVNELYKGYRIISNLPGEVIDLVYKYPDGVDLSKIIDTPISNEYFLLRNGKQTAMVRYNPLTNLFEKVREEMTAGLKSRNLEQFFALDALLNPNCSLVTLTGTPGSGKTILSLAAAIHQRKLYNQILLARPIIPLSNKEIGFLPGDTNEKIDPYMQPLYDNLKVIKGEFNNDKLFEQMNEQKKIEITPLPFIRGRSIPRVFFIIDEAQNLTPHEVKTIITRAGQGTKIVFTGDIYQIDSPYLDSRSNGLTYLIHKMKGQEIFSHINLEKSERSKLAELAANIL